MLHGLQSCSQLNGRRGRVLPPSGPGAPSSSLPAGRVAVRLATDGKEVAVRPGNLRSPHAAATATAGGERQQQRQQQRQRRQHGQARHSHEACSSGSGSGSSSSSRARHPRARPRCCACWRPSSASGTPPPA